MKKEEVLVAYIYEGKVKQCEIERGIVLSKDRVFVDGESGPSVYAYSRVPGSNLVTVNLDNGYTDYLRRDYSLIDIILGINRKPIAKHIAYYKKKVAADKGKMTQSRQNRLFKYKLALREHLTEMEWSLC